MLQKQILFAISLFVFCLFMTACGGAYIFEKTLDVEGGHWAYEDILKFEFSVEDTSKLYDLILEVEHAGDYGYQNLYVQFHTQYPSGENRLQVVSLELANKIGIWNGRCSGNKCKAEIPLQVNASFNETGKHSLSVEQYMRKSPLAGVKGMTLKVRPSGMR